jgi:hypothetical protein
MNKKTIINKTKQKPKTKTNNNNTITQFCVGTELARCPENNYKIRPIKKGLFLIKKSNFLRSLNAF